MWHLSDELEEHFDAVKSKRDSRGRGRSDDDDEEMGPMMKNEYARGRGRTR